MKRDQRRDDHTDTLVKALRRFDPNNELVPGSSAYKDAEAMILKWIDTYGPRQALQMVARSTKLLEDVKNAGGGGSSDLITPRPEDGRLHPLRRACARLRLSDPALQLDPPLRCRHDLSLEHSV